MPIPQASTWLRSQNLSADAKGSIHDDERARSLGFKAALVGGSVHSAFVTKAAVEYFGHAWYERGFMKQAYINPLYETDEFRIVSTPMEPLECDEELRELAFETKAGVRTTAGFFGILREGSDPIAPWQRPGAPELETGAPTHGESGDPFTFTRTVDVEESTSRRRVSDDASPWYTEHSPWGPAIVPSFMYMLIGSGSRPRQSGETTERAGMNSVWQLLQTSPMLAGVPHEVTTRIVEAGEGGRTAFRTHELAIATRDGRTVARARQKVRWFRLP